MEYIQENKDRDGGDECVFCELLEPSDEELEDRVLYRDQLAYATLAKYPYNPGHLLVLPVRHADELDQLSPEEHAAIVSLLQRCIAALREEMDPHGFNIGVNLGRAAGAGIPEHLHWHVVPRWGGDTNFMPVVGKTRVMPELLADTFARLKPRFEAP